MVLADGFAWSGQTYDSLSKVAFAITGTSGMAVFRRKCDFLTIFCLLDATCSMSAAIFPGSILLPRPCGRSRKACSPGNSLRLQARAFS
jgi:Protein of unknown function (DUF2924)